VIAVALLELTVFILNYHLLSIHLNY
jgi:hypothetical protein